MRCTFRSASQAPCADGRASAEAEPRGCARDRTPAEQCAYDSRRKRSPQIVTSKSESKVQRYSQLLKRGFWKLGALGLVKGCGTQARGCVRDRGPGGQRAYAQRISDSIAASIHDKYLVGPSIRPICTRCYVAMTNMIHLCSNFR